MAVLFHSEHSALNPSDVNRGSQGPEFGAAAAQLGLDVVGCSDPGLCRGFEDVLWRLLVLRCISYLRDSHGDQGSICHLMVFGVAAGTHSAILLTLSFIRFKDTVPSTRVAMVLAQLGLLPNSNDQMHS